MKRRQGAEDIWWLIPNSFRNYLFISSPLRRKVGNKRWKIRPSGSMHWCIEDMLPMRDHVEICKRLLFSCLSWRALRQSPAQNRLILRVRPYGSKWDQQHLCNAFNWLRKTTPLDSQSSLLTSFSDLSMSAFRYLLFPTSIVSKYTMKLVASLLRSYLKILTRLSTASTDMAKELTPSSLTPSQLKTWTVQLPEGTLLKGWILLRRVPA